jgi:hypothetical protein
VDGGGSGVEGGVSARAGRTDVEFQIMWAWLHSEQRMVQEAM